MADVFCDQCKYLRYRHYDNGGDAGITYLCSINPVYKTSFLQKDVEFSKPEIKNKNNDCKDFENGEPTRFYFWDGDKFFEEFIYNK